MQAIKDFIAGSFTNDKAGASARKLTAFALVVCYVSAFVIYCHCLINSTKWATDVFIEVLIVTLCGAAFFLGLISVTQLIQLKNGKNESANNQVTTANPDSSSSNPSELQG
jgi:hypothetical protein